LIEEHLKVATGPHAESAEPPTTEPAMWRVVFSPGMFRADLGIFPDEWFPAVAKPRLRPKPKPTKRKKKPTTPPSDRKKGGGARSAVWDEVLLPGLRNKVELDGHPFIDVDAGVYAAVQCLKCLKGNPKKLTLSRGSIRRNLLNYCPPNWFAKK
jgi:hypothetical protein